MAAASALDLDPNLSLEDMVKQIYLKVNKFDSLFIEQQAKIVSLEKDVISLKSEVRTLQDTLNIREQESRSLNLRITGVVYTEDEKSNPATLNKLVYDRVLLPILNLAKSNKILDRVPTVATTISSAYRLR